MGGGIGHEGDTCGALSGGVLALGLYHRDHPLGDLYRDCNEYFYRFTRFFGSSKCGDIVGVRFKEGYGIRRFMLKGIRCVRVVYRSIESVFDIIQRPERQLFPGNRARISPPFGSGRFDCASATLSRIDSRLHFGPGALSKAARGFSGGIAFQGDICGAFMGGVLALGILYGTELEKMQPTRIFKAGWVAMKEGSRVFQKEDLHPSFRTSLRVSRLYRGFVSRFGSANCKDILGHFKNRDLCEEIAGYTAQCTLTLHKQKPYYSFF